MPPQSMNATGHHFFAHVGVVVVLRPALAFSAGIVEGRKLSPVRASDPNSSAAFWVPLDQSARYNFGLCNQDQQPRPDICCRSDRVRTPLVARRCMEWRSPYRSLTPGTRALHAPERRSSVKLVLPTPCPVTTQYSSAWVWPRATGTLGTNCSTRTLVLAMILRSCHCAASLVLG